MSDINLSAQNNLGVSAPIDHISWDLFCEWCQTDYEPLADPIEEISFATLDFLGAISELDDTIDKIDTTTGEIPRDQIVKSAGQIIAAGSRLMDSWGINPLSESEDLDLNLNELYGPLFNEILEVTNSHNNSRKIDLIRNVGLILTTCAIRTAPAIQSLQYKINRFDDQDFLEKVNIHNQIQSILCAIMALSTIVRISGSSNEEVIRKHIIVRETGNQKHGNP